MPASPGTVHATSRCVIAYVCIYIYIYIHTYIERERERSRYTHIYIYIYIEREREREIISAYYVIVRVSHPRGGPSGREAEVLTSLLCVSVLLLVLLLL